MNMHFAFAKLPNNRKLLTGIEDAAVRLKNKIVRLNVDTLDISDYNKVYFKEKIESLTTNLQLYSYILVSLF